MDSKEFATQLSQVNESYSKRKRQEQESLSQVWRGFDKERKKLEGIISKEFKNILDEMGPLVSSWVKAYVGKCEGAIILDYNVDYEPERLLFKIKITKLKLPDGKIMDNKDILSSQYGCPHLYLDQIVGFSDDRLEPKIKEFKKKYKIRLIQEPYNNCEHK